MRATMSRQSAMAPSPTSPHASVLDTGRITSNQPCDAAAAAAAAAPAPAPVASDDDDDDDDDDNHDDNHDDNDHDNDHDEGGWWRAGALQPQSTSSTRICGAVSGWRHMAVFMAGATTMRLTSGSGGAGSAGSGSGAGAGNVAGAVAGAGAAVAVGAPLP